MNHAQLRASLALWKRREAYRLGKWRAYRDKRAQTPRVLALRHKWWGLYEIAREQVATREGQLKATEKKSKRLTAVMWAQAHVGVHEEPAGSNRGPLIDDWQRIFGFLAAPWCGIFCGNALRAAGVRGVTSRIASVSAIQEDAEAGRAPFSHWTPHSAKGALRGDLVVLFGPGKHVEIIEIVQGDGSVLDFGGNTSPAPGTGSEFAGGCVAHRKREASEIWGVAHVHYG